MGRPPLDVDGGPPPSGAEMSLARQIVRRSGVVETLLPHLDAEVGRPRRLPLEALLVALQLNALGRRHQAHLIDVARLLNAMTDEQRRSIGIKVWDEAEAYDRVDWLFNKLCRVLGEGNPGLDATWFANALARAAIPERYRMSHSLAVDGKDVETWGAFQGSVTTIELDGEASETQLGIDEPSAPKNLKKRAKVLGRGPDDRKIYTPDPDARAGHRSSNSRHNAGPYIGYELHLAVQTRDVRWTNHVDRTTLGPEVPNVITTCVLVPAGSHRAKSIVGHLIEAKRAGHDVRDVVWDPGYSLCQSETTTHPLARVGIEQTFELVHTQRGIKPFSKEAILMDGQLFSSALPDDLRDLASPPDFVKARYREAFEKPFNRRARWRYVRHARPNKDGVTRWRCPFDAGLLRCRNFPRTMRLPHDVPLVHLPADLEACCHGTVSASPRDLALTQRIPFGTTAWRISMNRRMVVESVNAALSGGFVDLARGFFRVFGVVKMTVLLGFTIAAANLDRIRSHEAKMEVANKDRPKRRPRREGTWRELLSTPTDNVPGRATGPPG
jgi:hypothetical protein